MAWLCLWRTRWRALGVLPILGALAIGFAERPPDILVSADARLIALRAGDELFLQRLSGASNLTRDAWLRLYAREPAAMPLPRWGRLAGGDIACEEGACTLRPSSGAPPAVLLRGAPPNEACAGAALVVSAEPVRGRCAARVVDRFSVWRDGAHAVWLDKTGPRVLSDRALRGARPWVPPVPKPRYAATPVGHVPRGGATAAARARASAVRSGVIRIGSSPTGGLVLPQQPDQAALHLDPVGAEDAGLVARVGGFQRDRVAAAAQPLQRHLALVHQRHDDGAVLGACRRGG